MMKIPKMNEGYKLELMKKQQEPIDMSGGPELELMNKKTDRKNGVKGTHEKKSRQQSMAMASMHHFGSRRVGFERRIVKETPNQGGRLSVSNVKKLSMVMMMYK